LLAKLAEVKPPRKEAIKANNNIKKELARLDKIYDGSVKEIDKLKVKAAKALAERATRDNGNEPFIV
jgi:hypothetical protein